MKTQNPIIGRAKGSAGGMTFSKNFDKNVARAKAFEVSNPKTTAQTTERSFFAEVMQVVSSVSDDQLRTLFGVKPKSKSRRNALTSQIAAAYSIDGTTKSVDFSKLQAIGNGKKINVPIAKIENGMADFGTFLGPIFLGQGMKEYTSLIYVIFDSDRNQIKLVNYGDAVADYAESSVIDTSVFGVNSGYIYATCETNGKYVESEPFGSYSINTRATDSTNNRGTRSLSSPTKPASAPKTEKPLIDVEPTNVEPATTETPNSEEENPVTE